jgi:hypothetical protein
VRWAVIVVTSLAEHNTAVVARLDRAIQYSRAVLD